MMAERDGGVQQQLVEIMSVLLGGQRVELTEQTPTLAGERLGSDRGGSGDKVPVVCHHGARWWTDTGDMEDVDRDR